MEFIDELIDKTNKIFSNDEMTKAILKSFDNTNTIEELLILKWHLGRVFYPSVIDFKNDNSFSKNIEVLA